MAYNLKLAERIRSELGEIPFVEKRMFGGVGYLIHGNMAVGVYKDDLIVRVAPDKHTKLLQKNGAKLFDITGRPMKGWLAVEPAGCKTKKQLNTWISESVEFTLTLKPK